MVHLKVVRAGSGPTVVLLHGWPHTWRLWSSVIPLLSSSCSVIAPDLRGLGESSRERDGYDAASLAGDVLGLVDGVDGTVAVVAIDAGVPAALWAALSRPDLVQRLVVMESLAPGLPAPGFAPPWWFGFHAVPGLAESVLLGHEAEYVDHFLTSGSVQPLPPEVRSAFQAAYTGREALRCGFEYYRAMPSDAAAFASRWGSQRLVVPTLAVAGGVVGEVLGRQLAPVTDDLRTASVPDCGHLVPLEQPAVLADLLLDFLTP